MPTPNAQRAGNWKLATGDWKLATGNRQLMLPFARLYDEIDSTTSTNAKVAAMARYFGSAPGADAAWAVFFLTGRRLKRLVPHAAIHEWALAATGLPPWLLQESYAVVGDGAETAALLLDQLPPAPDEAPMSLARWVGERVLALRTMDPDLQRASVMQWWAPLDRLQRFVLLKLLTGEFRVGVAQTLVVRALGQASGLPVATRLSVRRRPSLLPDFVHLPHVGWRSGGPALQHLEEHEGLRLVHLEEQS